MLNNQPINPYAMNLFSEVRAIPVILPLVSSDLTNSRNGARNTDGSNSERTANKY